MFCAFSIVWISFDCLEEKGKPWHIRLLGEMKEHKKLWMRANNLKIPLSLSTPAWLCQWWVVVFFPPSSLLLWAVENKQNSWDGCGEASLESGVLGYWILLFWGPEGLAKPAENSG